MARAASPTECPNGRLGAWRYFVMNERRGRFGAVARPSGRGPEGPHYPLSRGGASTVSEYPSPRTVWMKRALWGTFSILCRSGRAGLIGIFGQLDGLMGSQCRRFSCGWSKTPILAGCSASHRSTTVTTGTLGTEVASRASRDSPQMFACEFVRASAVYELCANVPEHTGSKRPDPFILRAKSSIKSRSIR
jgi:hypothetical protein